MRARARLFPRPCPGPCPANAVFAMTFRSTRNHTAIIVDEYGGFEGIVTPADILEAIVGEVPEPEERMGRNPKLGDAGVRRIESAHYANGGTPMMKRLLLLAALSLLAFGCAGEEPAAQDTAPATETAATATAASDAAPRTPPCDWITEAEATEALGQPSKYRSTVDDGSSNCIIDPVTEGMGISVDFKVTDDKYAWENESADAPTISGLGDVAVWTSPRIAVKKGDRYLIAHFSRMGAPEGDLKTPAVAFAQKIAEKM